MYVVSQRSQRLQLIGCDRIAQRRDVFGGVVHAVDGARVCLSAVFTAVLSCVHSMKG